MLAMYIPGCVCGNSGNSVATPSVGAAVQKPTHPKPTTKQVESNGSPKGEPNSKDGAQQSRFWGVIANLDVRNIMLLVKI